MFFKKIRPLLEKNIEHHLSDGECTQKKRVVFFKPCLQCIEKQKNYTLNCGYDVIKYEKIYIKMHLKCLLDTVCL